MEESFDIEVLYKEQELHFPARFTKYGYSYRIIVEVKGIEVIFEPDEERNFRARIEPHPDHASPHVDMELVKQIGTALEENLK